MKYVCFLLFAFFSFFSNAQAQVDETFSPESLQTPSNCGETLLVTYNEVNSSGGNFVFNVIAPQNCMYSVRSNAPSWLTVTSPPSATGNSIVSYFVSANQSLINPRVSVIVVGGKTYTVNQRRSQGVAARRSTLDFNGDRVTDFVAIENSNSNMLWWSFRYHIITGGSSSTTTFGDFNLDTPVPNDFDGDFRTDFAVWRSGTTPNEQSFFYVLESSTGVFRIVPWGVFGDNPNITQDFDGDFKADFAVTRKAAGKLYWFILLSATNTTYIQQFGNATDKPIRGDYDGDFRADLAVYRPDTDTPANTFFVLRSSNDALFAITFGLSDTDKIVPGDYNGDNATDFAVWRTTTGVWYWTSGVGFNAFQFGRSSDLPVPGDYNDDGITDFAVWRPDASQGVFWVRVTAGAPFISVLPWGNSSMKIPANLMQVQ